MRKQLRLRVWTSPYETHAFELFIQSEADAMGKAAALRARGLAVAVTLFVGGLRSRSRPPEEMQTLWREVLADTPVPGTPQNHGHRPRVER